ncbi:zinc transporter 5-like [Cucurbita pepo subsp. pepo]|uniref:zinc transporter 5-like n=1 Tax=Cucurbita pepo subsp. pepo TaxID=3664 RepID=UPI000C9D8115|nr:zinc transporter 5-like [Cucurbita pepo subsp. pepo]
MMSPGSMSQDRGSSPHFRHTPLQIIHMLGNFFRIWSIYSMYRYFSQAGASVVLFLFCCLGPAAIIFLTLQKPWKGKPLPNTQVVPSVINGGITALYFILWGKGIKACGPLRAILAEYSGAVLGVLSAVLYGRRGFVWKKVGGLVAMLVSFYLLSQGWAMATHFPFSAKDGSDAENQTEQVLGLKEMAIPIFAGILSTLRRVIARRVSLKNQLKRRLHSITMASATCFLFPMAMWDMIIGSTSDNDRELPFSTWAFISTTIFGVILIFYVDSIAEERLHMVFSSPRHLVVAGGSIILLEIVYKMDFSLVGFVICCSILGFGIHEATSLDRSRKDSSRNHDTSNGLLDDQDQLSSLPT